VILQDIPGFYCRENPPKSRKIPVIPVKRILQKLVILPKITSEKPGISSDLWRSFTADPQFQPSLHTGFDAFAPEVCFPVTWGTIRTPSSGESNVASWKIYEHHLEMMVFEWEEHLYIDGG
jgi:hypothetical protein